MVIFVLRNKIFNIKIGHKNMTNGWIETSHFRWQVFSQWQKTYKNALTNHNEVDLKRGGT